MSGPPETGFMRGYGALPFAGARHAIIKAVRRARGALGLTRRYRAFRR